MPFAARCSTPALSIAALLASACAPDWPPPPDTRVEVVTDTIPLDDRALACPRIRRLSIAELLAESILRICTGRSVGELFME